MARSKKPRYCHEALNTPIRLSGLRAIPLSTGYDPQKLYTKERAEKMDLLLEAYGIAPDDPETWRALAYLLACDYVPGFKHVTRKRGRPCKWQGRKSVELYADVKSLESEGMSVRSACRVLTTSPRFKSRYEGETDKNLRGRYAEALDKMNDFMKHFIKDRKANEAQVDQILIKRFALFEK